MNGAANESVMPWHWYREHLKGAAISALPPHTFVLERELQRRSVKVLRTNVTFSLDGTVNSICHSMN
jgi:hypothetical protein